MDGLYWSPEVNLEKERDRCSKLLYNRNISQCTVLTAIIPHEGSSNAARKLRLTTESEQAPWQQRQQIQPALQHLRQGKNTICVPILFALGQTLSPINPEPPPSYWPSSQLV